MKETDPRFVSLQKKVILFFAVAVIGIIGTLIFLGVERGAFTAKYRIHFTVEKGTGFFEGMPVKLSGFKIGKIETLSLDENARVKILLLLDKKYQKWIRQDSRAMLTKEGLIGEDVIDVTVGAQGKPVIEDGAVIPYEKSRGLDELVEEVRPVIGEIKDIISYINDPDADIKQTLANLQMLSFELLITKENIDKLLKNTDVNITDVASSLSKAVKNIDSTVTDIDKTILNIEGKVSPAMDKLNKTMGNAEEATSNLKDAIEKSAPKLPRLLNKGEDALNDTNEVIRSLKQVWPISSYIEEPKDSLLRGDSYE